MTIRAYAHFDKGCVRVLVSSEDPNRLRFLDEKGDKRVMLFLTRKQSIALAYKLLHAANDAEHDIEMPPMSSVKETA